MDTTARQFWAFAILAFSAHAAIAQEPELVRAQSDHIADQLSTIHRYDSDITIHAGAWVSRFVHLRLHADKPAEVVFLLFNPRLLSQVFDAAEAGNRAAPARFVEFYEYSFLVENCEGLSAQIDDLKSALSESIASIGQRPMSRSLEVVTVDGRYYRLKARIDRDFEASFGASENDQRLFEPVDAIVRTAGICSQDTDGQRRRHDF